MKKVVIITPINENKSYVIREFLDNVRNFTYENKEVILVDNSDSRAFMAELEREYPEFRFVYDKPTPRLPLNHKISSSQTLAFNRAMRYNPDFVLSLECDVFPPIDCIEQLMTHDKEIVGYTYPTGIDSERKPIVMNVYDSGVDVSLYEENHITATEYLKGDCVPVASIGLGCVLFRKEVFPFMDFKVFNQVYSDSALATKLYFKGFEVYLDSSEILIHKNSEKQYK